MHNLRALVLALVAMFAMNAVVASAATADDLTAEKSPVTLTGKNIDLTDQMLTTTGSADCKITSYVATVLAPTTSFTATPGYSNCAAFGFPAVIDVNGCEYVFNIGAGTTGDTDIKCPAGKSITITAIGAGTIKCTVHISSQSDITGVVTYGNVGAGTTREIGIGMHLGGIDYSHTKGTGLGACPAGSATNGSVEANALMTGEEDKASGALHVGIFLS